jgi:hypothetical protein
VLPLPLYDNKSNKGANIVKDSSLWVCTNLYPLRRKKTKKHRIYRCLLRLVFLPKWKAGSAPYRDIPRTLDNLVQNLWGWFKENPTGRLASYLNEISLPDKGSRFAA